MTTLPKLDLTRSKAALAAFDADEPRRLAVLEAVKTDADFAAFEAMEKAEEMKVKQAFYEDTADRNSRTTILQCMSVNGVRKMVESLG
jgi:hypothetical protein